MKNLAFLSVKLQQPLGAQSFLRVEAGRKPSRSFTVTGGI